MSAEAVAGRWSMELRLEEDDERTVAVAKLVTGDRTLHGRGTARRNPLDPSLPRVGEDLAVSRALSELAHELLSDAVAQLEGATHRPSGIREG
ncbi:MAG TPA: DUF1876 domain-containing protein [Candidatus Binatia bacterium]|nr:DUF1876 domain-containing protein [Candidatus Binatia bacterium]